MTIEDKVNILINDLEESQYTRTQNFTCLASDDGEKITTYCALGALGCVKKLIYFREKSKTHTEPPAHQIIEAYGINNEMCKPVIIPMLHHRESNNSIRASTEIHLDTLIISCNDYGHFTFTEIASFIRVLLKSGYFKECTQKVELAAQRHQRGKSNSEIKQKYEDMPNL